MVECKTHQRLVERDRDGRYVCTAVAGKPHELLPPTRPSL
jgi:hypothetical protein